MARVGSINHQVGLIIKAHNGIRQSKLERRNESGLLAENNHKVSNLIHSYKSLDDTRKNLKNLGNYAKSELGIKDMSKIGINGIREWINSKDIAYRSASNYLSEINTVHEHLGVTKEEVKELRAELKQKLPKTRELVKQTRFYKHLDKVHLDEKPQIAFELQRDYGLRVKEATHINLQRQLNGDVLSCKQGIGRLREIELTPTLASKIRENAVNGKYEVNYKTYGRKLKKAIEKTGQKYNGTHGIRHSFVINKLESGATKAEVAKLLGNITEESINEYLR